VGHRFNGNVNADFNVNGDGLRRRLVGRGFNRDICVEATQGFSP
jgi:hypothetical protein